MDFDLKQDAVATLVNAQLKSINYNPKFNGGKVTRFRDKRIIPMFLYKNIGENSSPRYRYAEESVDWAFCGYVLNSSYSGLTESSVGYIFEQCIARWGSQHSTIEQVKSIHDSSTDEADFIQKLVTAGVNLDRLQTKEKSSI
jgi:hypothetical protein